MSFKFVMGMRLKYSCRNFDRLIFVLPSRINFEVLPPRHHIVNIDRFSTTAPKRNVEELKKRKEEFEVETIFLDESMVSKKGRYLLGFIFLKKNAVLPNFLWKVWIWSSCKWWFKYRRYKLAQAKDKNTIISAVVIILKENKKTIQNLITPAFY